MSKKIHLVCNAHLDPVWQWEWEEGAAETLSTFRIAADFCDEYDGFVFCHNEALLYKWIEEYDPELFIRIQKLVKEGKWNIMGGWHLQPDCNMPSGESFVRNIFMGRKYFKEKFGVVPTVAMNVDPFGHSRGLVQIMKKAGYDGYVFMRPSPRDIELPSNEFKWIGYDGSELVGVRLPGGYNSGKGRATQKILDYIDRCDEDDIFLCFWGIGNHGGGPSKKDLDDISALIKEQAEKDVEIVHSTPEKYIDEIRNKDTLPVFSESLNSWAVGCYTSQVRVKQKYRQAENEYYLTEIMCTQASEAGLIKFPEEKFYEAMYDIATVQFHDMLPGSSIQPAEEMCIRMLDHALEILSRLKAQAFFALASGQKKADDDKIPVLVYNPYPYPVKGDYISEFMLWDQVRDINFMRPVLYDEEGNEIPCQCEKEYSSLPIEWRKRIVFNTTLKPMQVNRFDCAFIGEDKKPDKVCDSTDTHFVFSKGGLCVKINKNTGLVDFVSKNNVQYMGENAFCTEIWNDNFDPWYMSDDGWYEKIDEFTLLTKEQTKEFCCVNESIEPVRVIESGDVRTVIEAVFGYKSSRAVIKYVMSNSGEFETEIRINWNEKQKLVKLNIPASFNVSDCVGEHPFGRESLYKNFKENVSQKYVALTGEDKAIIVSNNGVYGSSYKGNELKITLLRSPSYCAHPIDDRVVMMQDRYLPYIEQGERDFKFKFDFGKKNEVVDKSSRIAQQFNMKPMALSLYPTGVGVKTEAPFELSGTSVINVVAMKKATIGEGIIVRLFNPTDSEQIATFRYKNHIHNISFSRFEVVTLRCSENCIDQVDLLEGLLNT